MLTHPDPEQSTQRFDYKYVDGAPYFLQIRGDERNANSNTYFTRDPVTNRVTKIWYPDYPNGPTEEFTYNGLGQVLTHTMTSGGVEVFEYDNGANDRGLLTSYTPPATPSDPQPGQHPTRYYYYTSGPQTDRLWHVVDPRGNATWFEYNVRGQVTKVTHQDGSYIQKGYNLDGTLAWTADENHPNASWNVNERTRYVYDDYKRIVSVTNPMNETRTINYALDWVNPYLHTTNSIKYVLSSLNKNVVFDYDENFRKIDQVAALGTADVAWTLFGYDEVGNLTSTQDPRGNVTTFGYDNRNRRTSATDPSPFNSQVTRWEYDTRSNVTKETRPDLAYQRTEYDPMSRVIDTYGFAAEHIHYQRDLAGNVLEMTDPKGTVYSFEYDALNRKTKETSDLYGAQRVETWHYDPAGNADQFTNRAGNIQTLFYDNRNRPFGFDWNDGFTPQQRTQYDAASRVTQIWNWYATINFTYFDNNLLKTQQEVSGSNYNHTISYAYDADGNRQSMTCPSTKVWQYAYTGRNQLASIMNANQVALASYQYDQAGNLQQRSLYNGTVTEYAPADALDRSSWVRHRFNGTEVARFDYAFDQLSRLKYEQRNSATADGYGYDAAGQVTGFNRDGTLSNGTVTGGSLISSLVYDLAGNRAQVTNNGTTTAWSANNLNEYTSANGSSANSDVKGNLQNYNGWTYTYDAQNRLRSAVNGGTSVEFWYDGLNRQIARRINGSAIIRSVWEDGWDLLEERDGNDAPVEYYLHGAQTDELVVRWGGAYGDTWYAQDGRGNTSHLFDYNGIVERYTYGLAGEPKIFDGSGAGRTESPLENRFMFSGREYIKELGLYDFRTRFYYPTIGRFVQSDPIGFDAGDANLFRYCAGDPVNESDPLGLDGGNDRAHDRDNNDREIWGQTPKINVDGEPVNEQHEPWSVFRPLDDYFNSLFSDDKSRVDNNPGHTSNVDSSLTGQVKAVLDYFAPSLGGTEMAGTITSKRKVILGSENRRTDRSSVLPRITSDTIAIWHFHLLNVPGAENPYIFSYPPFGKDKMILDAYPNIPQFVGVLDGPPGQFTIFGYMSPEQPYVIVRPNKGITPGF